MMLSRRARLGLALAPALVTLLLGALLFYAIGEVQEHRQSVRRSGALISAAERTLSDLKDAETGQRGFLLTGEPRYLAPYDSALGRVSRDLDALRMLARQDTAQRRAVEQLAPLAAAKLAELEETIRLRQEAGFDAAVAVVRSGRGKAIMDSARIVIRHIRARETERLAAAEAGEEARERMVGAALVFGTLVGAGAAFLLNLVLVRNARELEASSRVIEERNRELEALNRRVGEREEHFRTLIEDGADLIMVIGDDGAIRYASPSMMRLLGHRPDDVLGSPALDLLHQDDVPAVEAVLGEAAQNPGRTLHARVRSRHADGSWRVMEAAARFLDGAGVNGTLINARDVTERDAAERALREARDTFRALVDASPLAILALDSAGRMTMWNPAAEAMFGWTHDEVLGRPNPIVPEEREEEYARIMERERAGEVVTGLELVRQRRDGSPVPVSLSSAPLRGPDGGVAGTVALLADLTDRRRAEAALAESEEQLRQAQKMEAIGRLAGGVAHDFNNLLTIIRGYVEMLLEDLPEGNPAREDLDEARRAVERGAALTRQLLAFSRKQLLQPRVLDLNEVVRGTDKLLRRTIGEDVELQTRLSEPLWPVRADPGQVEQVLMNLAVNARDAMPVGGALRVESGNLRVPDGGRPVPGFVAPGEYVLLSVHDDGAGMDADTRRRAFEPFFTTKGEGKGTGMGLSTVYGIIKQSGGFVWIDSAPGRGTSVHVCLPRTRAEEDAAPAPEPAPRPDGGRGETVLLVEDEAGVRDIASRLLRRNGYRVLEAGSGPEALRLALEHRERIDLVLTDVVMPGFSGGELLHRLRERAPSLPVLFMSGYTDDALANHGVLESAVHIVEKPFAPAELLRAVRAALGGTPP